MLQRSRKCMNRTAEISFHTRVMRQHPKEEPGRARERRANSTTAQRQAQGNDQVKTGKRLWRKCIRDAPHETEMYYAFAYIAATREHRQSRIGLTAASRLSMLAVLTQGQNSASYFLHVLHVRADYCRVQSMIRWAAESAIAAMPKSPVLEFTPG